MRKFNYEARDKATDTIIKSIVQAESEMAAARVLTEQGFVPLDIKEVDESGGLFGSLTRRVTTKDKVVFTRQLATLIGAGLPLSQSLRTVLEQTENKKLQEIIQEIIADVEGGRQLSDSFGKHPEIFDKIYLSLVTAGEASGTLDQALKRVASQQEKDAAMVSKIRGAMTYPAIVLAVIMGVMLFMLLVVVPQVEKLYSDMHKTLPFLTAALIAVAKFTASFWWVPSTSPANTPRQAPARALSTRLSLICPSSVVCFASFTWRALPVLARRCLRPVCLCSTCSTLPRQGSIIRLSRLLSAGLPRRSRGGERCLSH